MGEREEGEEEGKREGERREELLKVIPVILCNVLQYVTLHN